MAAVLKTFFGFSLYALGLNRYCIYKNYSRIVAFKSNPAPECYIFTSKQQNKLDCKMFAAKG